MEAEDVKKRLLGLEDLAKQIGGGKTAGGLLDEVLNKKKPPN